jgi:aminoglycoside 6-adenylyltransferase
MVTKIVNSGAYSSGYAHILEGFLAWAQQEETIRGVIVIGSRARKDHPADEWADLDLLLLVTDLNCFTEKSDWLNHIAPVWLTHTESTADGRSLERRALFEGGLDVDFAFFPVTMVNTLLSGTLGDDAWDVFRRGARIVLDKDYTLQRALAAMPPAKAYEPPSESTFLNSVNNFWYHSLWTAKHLRRGELIWAKGCCDGLLKELLRQMLEWQARAKHGAEFDTWLRGRFLEEWVDARVLPVLPDIYTHYDEADIWRALFASMRLYAWVSQETAEHLDYTYPLEGAIKACEATYNLVPHMLTPTLAMPEFR